MIAQQHGDEQFKAWRRGYTVRPPKVSSFSLDYPGNDVRYKYLNDVRISVSESLMRSFDSGKLVLHRKFPKTGECSYAANRQLMQNQTILTLVFLVMYSPPSESLKDCMSRVIPFFRQQILNEAINKGKRVL